MTSLYYQSRNGKPILNAEKRTCAKIPKQFDNPAFDQVPRGNIVLTSDKFKPTPDRMRFKTSCPLKGLKNAHLKAGFIYSEEPQQIPIDYTKTLYNNYYLDSRQITYTDGTILNPLVAQALQAKKNYTMELPPKPEPEPEPEPETNIEDEVSDIPDASIQDVGDTDEFKTLDESFARESLFSSTQKKMMEESKVDRKAILATIHSDYQLTRLGSSEQKTLYFRWMKDIGIVRKKGAFSKEMKNMKSVLGREVYVDGMTPREVVGNVKEYYNTVYKNQSV